MEENEIENTSRKRSALNETVVLEDDESSCSSAKKKKIMKEVFEYELTDDKNKIAKCKLCFKNTKIEKIIKMKDGNTAGTNRHLKMYHKEHFRTAFPDKPLDSSEKFIQQKFEDMTVEWLSRKYLPLNFFNDEITQKYFQYLNKNAEVPMRNKMRSLVNQKFTDLEIQVKEILQKNSSKISYCVDGWTSVAQKSYYGVQGHYIDDDWILQSVTLDLIPSKGSHTGKSTAKLFYNFLEEYGLKDKVQGITLDNTGANSTFITELELLLNSDISSEDLHFRCLAHILNLGAMDLLTKLSLQSEAEFEAEIEDSVVDDEDDNDHGDDEHDNGHDDEGSNENENNDKGDNNDDGDKHESEINIPIDASPVIKLKNLFKTLKYSEKLREKLKCCCVTVGINFMSPIIDVKTRWHSTHDMIDRALKLKKALILLCETDPLFKNLKIMDSDWDLLGAVVKYLKYFKTLSNILCGEKYVTLPYVVVGFNILLDKIEKGIEDLNVKINKNLTEIRIRAGLQAALQKLMKHYKKTNWVYCAVLVLDPRHKVETFYLTTWGTEMAKWSIKKFEEIYKSTYYQEEEHIISEIPLQSKDTDGNSDEDDDDIDPSSLYSSETQTKKSAKNSSRKETQGNWRKELDHYLQMNRADKSTDILMWWKNHQTQFPTLSKMARDFLSIQATSVPVERLFSRCSLTIRKHRNKLGDSTSRELLCLNSWTSRKEFSSFNSTQ